MRNYKHIYRNVYGNVYTKSLSVAEEYGRLVLWFTESTGEGDEERAETKRIDIPKWALNALLNDHSKNDVVIEERAYESEDD